MVSAAPAAPTIPFPSPDWSKCGSRFIELHRTERRRDCGRRMTIWCMRWLSISGTVDRGTGNRATSLRLMAWMIYGFDQGERHADYCVRAAPGGGLYASSSNLGKIFLLGAGPSRKEVRERRI